MLIIYVRSTLCILINNIDTPSVRNLSRRSTRGAAVLLPAVHPSHYTRVCSRGEIQVTECGGEKLNWCSYVPESLQSYGSLSEFKQGKLIHIPWRRGEEV